MQTRLTSLNHSYIFNILTHGHHSAMHWPKSWNLQHMASAAYNMQVQSISRSMYCNEHLCQ